MLILLVVVAVVAVAGAFAYPNIKDALVPSTPDIPVPDTDMAAEIEEVLQGIETEPAIRPQARPENIVPDHQGTVSPEPAPETTSVETTEDESTEEEEGEPEELADNSTAANDAKEDGINDAYFAEEVFVEKGEEVAGTYDEYTFGNDKNYPENEGNKEGDADYILENTRSILNEKKEFTTKEAILAGITEDVYNKGDAISFVTYKMTPEYKKIDSALLSSEVYIVAKTTNLDEETVTITIKEKEALLVAEDAPLPVLDIPENEEEESKENQTHTRNEARMNDDTGSETDSGTAEAEASDSSETTEQSETEGEPAEKDAEENEITEIKAIVEEGIAKKKIKLRPKSAEDLQTWTEKLKGGAEDGMHTYQVQNQFSVTGDADAIATNIQNSSNNELPDHIVKKEDILELLVEGTTYNNTTSFVFPKYKKDSQTEFLWLKTHAYGGEEEHNEEFLNQDDTTYFRIGGCACKQYDLIWGNKVNCAFRKKVVEISKDLWGEEKKIEMANNLMAVFQWESGGTFKAGVPNQGNSGGTGLIQFMPDTAAYLLGKSITIEYTSDFWGRRLKRVKEFAEMTELEQLDYVKKYFEPLSNKDVEFVDFYLQVLFPASMGKPDDHVVFSRDGSGLDSNDRHYRLRIRAYSQNAGFDTELGNNDGMVTKKEIKDSVQKYIDDGENNRAINFECDGKWVDPIANGEWNLHTFGGAYKPSTSSFGATRNGGARNHQGFDIFAEVGTSLYACLDGTIVSTSPISGYGITIILKIDNVDDLKSAKNEYALTYPGEIENGPGFNLDGDIYLRYAHSESATVSVGDSVKAGQIIGKSGVSGSASGTRAPHLHFEISNKLGPGRGLADRTNPAFYGTIKLPSDSNRSYQQEAAQQQHKV